jgi:hypothetical protein
MRGPLSYESCNYLSSFRNFWRVFSPRFCYSNKKLATLDLLQAHLSRTTIIECVKHYADDKEKREEDLK